MAEVAKVLKTGRVRYVDAQVAIAVHVLLAQPLRPQNLSSLCWRHHFSEPNGPRSELLIHIPAAQTKTKKHDIVSEVPDEVARRIRWYRRHILPRLGADLNGHLFVTKRGGRKSQPTITIQIIRALARHIGVHMTPINSGISVRSLISRSIRKISRRPAAYLVTPGARPHEFTRAPSAGAPAGHTTSTYSSSAKPSS